MAKNTIKLPSKMTHQRVAILELLIEKSTKDAPLRWKEVEEGVIEEHRNRVDKILYQISMKGWIDKIDSRYAANATTRAIIKNKPNMALMDATQQRGPNKTQQSLPLAAPQPAPIEVNLSASADTLIGNISSVIEENAQYRELLLKLHTTITKALQLDEVRPDGNSAQD